MAKASEKAAERTRFRPVGPKLDLPELRQLLALALARSGASDSANAVLQTLYKEGHRDEETLGLLARTYKDLYQRYKAMLGYDQRYQNGFDCQGLWVEVQVERELNLNSKRDIETYGIAKFSEACRQRVDRHGSSVTVADDDAATPG